MKILLLLPLLLAGCSTLSPYNNTEVLTTKQYVVRTAPDELKTLPPLPPAIPNPKAASNSQIATWISDTEAYVQRLESQIQTIVNFYEAPVSTTEAASMQPVTPRSPATPDSKRVIHVQTAATPASGS